ncbi:MAG: hypothetical protein KJ949_00255 [Nanoarchaeota archaeon]|nr:hypothetical protein [Nanoarchaeota archaeon]
MNRKEILEWYRQEFDKISKGISNKKNLSYFDFLRIRNFKLQNSSRDNKENVKEITKKAFNLAKKDEIEEAISKLLKLHGVAIPIASTILAMKYPDKYCIIDRIVLKNIGKEEWLKQYLSNPKIYKEYLLLMRKLAKNKNMDLRNFERNLFENGSI